MATVVLARSDRPFSNGGSRVTLTVGVVLALWLELSVSIILYCAEIVALLIGAPRSRRAPEIRAEAEADAAIVSSVST